MPELPEVEVVKLFLEDHLLGHTITDLNILNPGSFIGPPSSVIGQKILKFTRLGKQLSIHLANNLVLLVHLKMTGQLIIDGQMLGHPNLPAVASAQAGQIHSSTRLIFHFSPLSSSRGTKGEIMYFNDQRKFGWVKVLTPPELVAGQSVLGYDIFDPRFTSHYLYTQLQRSRRPVKVVLLDQHFFAGIGNIYANDSLFLSGIHPTLPAHQVTFPQCQLIHHHLIAIMQQSITSGGSTTKDRKYVRPDGSSGSNQFFFRVYERRGEPCLVCGTAIKYLKVAGRGTFFCPHCQR